MPIVFTYEGKVTDVEFVTVTTQYPLFNATDALEALPTSTVQASEPLEDRIVTA
jgi:hypothetical protein